MDEEKIEKERQSFHLPKDIIERAKNAVYWTPGLTLAELGGNALKEYLDKLERERGEPFPPRKGRLTPGRPIK